MNKHRLPIAFILGAVASAPAQAAITPAPWSGVNVLATRSGVEVVDIVPPTTAGVSINRYQRFDVDAPGAVLRNSAGYAQSVVTGELLAGSPNPHFREAAKLIINEVRGQGASILAGPLEVAGAKADLLIANPNGVSCDGCAFINAGRVALSTGTPRFNMLGALETIDVNDGTVRIGPAGMVADAAGLARLELLARSVDIQGPVDVPGIEAVAGVHQVRWNDLAWKVNPAHGAAPAFAIRVDQGIQARHIHLVATEQGVGINGRGRLAASNGELRVQTDGDLDFTDPTSHLSSAQNLALTALGSITVHGRMHAAQGCVAISPGNLRVHANVKAAGNIQFRAGVLDISASALHADAWVDLFASTGAIQAVDTRVSSDLGIDVASQGLFTADGARWISGGDLHIKSDAMRSDAGSLLDAGGTLQVRAHSLGAPGTTLRGETVRLETDVLNAADSVIDARDTVEIHAPMHADLPDGLVKAAKHVDLTAGALANTRGVIMSGGDATITTQGDLDNECGSIRAGTDLTLSAGRDLANSGGFVGGNGAMNMNAGQSLINTWGRVFGFGPTLRIMAPSGINNTRGAIAAPSGAIHLMTWLGPAGSTEAAFDNTMGVLEAGRDLRWQGRNFQNLDGAVSAEGNIGLIGGSVSNMQGVISSVGSQSWHLHGSVTNQDGTITTSAGDIAFSLHGGAIDNTEGTIEAPQGRVTGDPAWFVGDPSSPRVVQP